GRRHAKCATSATGGKPASRRKTLVRYDLASQILRVARDGSDNSSHMTGRPPAVSGHDMAGPDGHQSQTDRCGAWSFAALGSYAQQVANHRLACRPEGFAARQE